MRYFLKIYVEFLSVFLWSHWLDQLVPQKGSIKKSLATSLVGYLFQGKPPLFF